MPPLFSSPRPQGFRDRIDAGDQLAEKLRGRLATLTPQDIVIVGLARGGVIVAAEIARQLDVRLEAIVVRKLGAPDQPELAIGALAASGDLVLNQPLIDEIGLSEADVQAITDRATDAARVLCEEIGAPPMVPNIAGRSVVLVDDGLATGATMRVAIKAGYDQEARQVIVAVPVAPDSAVEAFQQITDDVITLITPEHLMSVGQWYQSFLEVPSAQVREALESNPYHETP